MTDVLITCGECCTDVEVQAEATILRVGVDLAEIGELMFSCPDCESTNVVHVAGDALAVLMRAGARPLTLDEPALDDCDLPPAGGVTFVWQDLLDWHEQLAGVASVEPWE